MENKELEDIINKIEEKKRIIRKERDEIRDLFYKFIHTPDFLENGTNELEVGLADIGNGIYKIEDSMSSLREELDNYEDELNKANEKAKWTVDIYKELRLKCKHKRKTYKDKYGGYYCDVCDSFLPRGPK